MTSRRLAAAVSLVVLVALAGSLLALAGIGRDDAATPSGASGTAGRELAGDPDAVADASAGGTTNGGQPNGKAGKAGTTGGTAESGKTATKDNAAGAPDGQAGAGSTDSSVDSEPPAAGRGTDDVSETPTGAHADPVVLDPPEETARRQRRQARSVVRLPLPSAAAGGGIVSGYPRRTVHPIPGSTELTSSLAPAGRRLQVSLEARTRKSASGSLRHYRIHFSGLGFTERPVPAAGGSQAAAFVRGQDRVVVTVTPGRPQTSYTVYASLVAAKG